MTTAGLPPIGKIAELLGGEVRGDHVYAPGPGHSVSDRSLSVLVDASAPDGFVIHSFAGDDAIACRDYVRDRLGLPAFEAKKKKANGKGGKWSLLAEYVYRDTNGEPYLLVKKYLDANGKKQFPQFHWDGKQWLEGKPAGPKIPYRLPELLAAPVTTTVFFCEGEKDVDNLTKLSFVATTASEGANASWDPALTQYFKDRPVVILVDADKPGRAHGQKVAKALNGVAASVKVVDLFPDKNDGSDVSDWLEDDRVGSRLAKLAKESDEWKPSADDSKADTNKADEALIFELAALTKLQYAKRRKEAADEIGITVSALDKIVAEARGESKDKEPAPALYEHWNVEPWDEAVDGDVLLRALVEAIRRYVVMSDEQMLVVASWIMLTWLHEQIVVHSPVLLVTSPLPNSGKTTLLKVASFLVRNGLSSVSITGPALFRSIEKWAPTIAIDEADTAIINNDDLKDVINSGWTRGETVIRCDDKTHEPRPYSTFCPKAIGMIGRKLPPATLSRCLVIALRRKRPDEEADDFDHIDNEHLARLRSQLLRWATDNAEVLGKAKPEKPPGLHNRTWMNWRLLLAITEQCNWKQVAWKAVRAIEEVHAASDPELGVQLLADIRDAFDRLGDRIPTKALIEALTEDSEGPWLSYGKAGKPISERQLARLLKDFRQGHGIRPKVLRATGIAGTPRGYLREDFEGDFAAYIPSVAAKTPSVSATPQQMNIFNDLEAENIRNTRADVADKMPPNQLETNICCGVADENPGFAATEGIGLVDGDADHFTPPSEPSADSAIQDAISLPEGAKLIGRAGAGERCFSCGKAGRVYLIRHRPGVEPAPLHPACAFAGPMVELPQEIHDELRGDAGAGEEDRSCRQCDGTIDGTERHYQIDGGIWLHPECKRFYRARTKEDAPW